MHRAKTLVSNQSEQKATEIGRKQYLFLILKVIAIAVATSTCLHFLKWPNILPMKENYFDYDSMQKLFGSDNQDFTHENIKYSICSKQHQDVKNSKFSSESHREANCTEATEQNQTVDSSAPIQRTLKNDVRMTIKCEDSPSGMISDF